MRNSRRDFLKKAALGSAGAFMLGQPVIGSTLIPQDEDLSVLSNWLRFSKKTNPLYNYYYAIANSNLNERKETVSGLTTKQQWVSRQKTMRERILKCIGGEFPAKRPLNPKTTGYIKRDDYTIEKVIYETLPGYYVTGCLFIPHDGKAKKPGLIFCTGHTRGAFRAKTYQHEILNFVKKGFVVLSYDPIGLGERKQYYNPSLGKSMVGIATSEHSFVGAQCFLTGYSLARYYIWDGIRAVDYLLTRDEVDPERIGITGVSGGGTQTAYIGAFDDRLIAAAPERYITSFQRLIQSIGPQDAEQNFYKGLEKQIEHADLLEQRAPNPTLVVSTTRDYFSIQGARETAREVERVYEIFGKPENFSMIADNAEHDSTVKNRERKYAFFMKHLKVQGSPADEQVEFHSVRELTVTKTGQVLTSREGKMAYHLNRERADRHLQALYKRRESTVNNVRSLIPQIKKISGYSHPKSDVELVFTGRYVRDGYQIEKYFINGPGKYKIPYLMFRPDGKSSNTPVLIYLHPGGKSSEARRRGEIEALVNRGYLVIAPDIIGSGELGPVGPPSSIYQTELGPGPYGIWHFSVQVGKSIVAARAADIIRVLQSLKNHRGIQVEQISALARGNLCTALMHAAAFDESILKIALIDPLISFQSVVMHKYYQPGMIEAAVPGAITAYDLPDLAACLAPRTLWMINVQDHRKRLATQKQIDDTYRFTRETYASKKAHNNFVIKSWDFGQDFSDIMKGWLGK